MSRKSESYYRWADIPEDKLRPDLSRKVIHGENMTVSMFFFKKGAKVELHKHVNEQISYVLSGAVRFFTADGKEYVVSQGTVMYFPSNVEHGALALEDSVAIEMFSPPREDWKKGTDQYLRR
ncbi:MAG: cupin domain-containing protein [Nitrososphaerota archaeon]